MNVAENLLPVILDASAKGAVILAFAWIVTTLLMRRSSAAARHTVWLLAISSLLALPLLAVALPQWQVLPEWLTLSLKAEATEEVAALVEPTPVLPLDQDALTESIASDDTDPRPGRFPLGHPLYGRN
ncbi:MAG: hypothetical protein SGJ20_00580, partial [Planctomycetota bacterium]|nr:hypothetical protein [Planctomycetota bacterium]